MGYDAVQWQFSNITEVLDLIGAELPGVPGADQTITVMTPNGVGYAQRNQWIYRNPSDLDGVFRIGDTDPNEPGGMTTA